jgi:multiple sugar transport system substrate-binding protein
LPLQNFGRRHLTRLIGCLAIVGASCSSASAQEITLRVTAAPSINSKGYVAVAQAFEQQNPNVKIQIEASNRDYEQLLQQTLRENLTNSLPDLSFQGGDRLRTLVDNHLAIALDPSIASDPGWAQAGVGKVATSIGTVYGKVFGISFGYAPAGVFYNLDLVRKAGADPSHLPGTWDGITDLAKKIDAAVGGQVTGGFFQYDASGAWTFMSMIGSYGEHFLSPDEKRVAFDGSAGVETLRILRRFGEAGQARNSMSRDQARQAFAAGTIGVLVDYAPSIEQIEPTVAGKFEVRLEPFPLPNPEGTIPAAGPVMVLFAKEPQRQHIALEFIKFAAGPAAQKLMVETIGLMPVNETALRDPELLGDFFRAHPNFASMTVRAPNLTAWYALPGPNGVKITDIVKDYLRLSVVTTQPLDEIMLAMKRDVTRLLAE